MGLTTLPCKQENCWEASKKFSRILWRRPRPKLGCGAKERERELLLILLCTKVYVHARPVSPGIAQQVMPAVYTSGSLDTWTIVCLTATKFKPFVFPMLGFVFAYVSDIHIIVTLYVTITLQAVNKCNNRDASNALSQSHRLGMPGTYETPRSLTNISEHFLPTACTTCSLKKHGSSLNVTPLSQLVW
jgi:hypothetical protein